MSKLLQPRLSVLGLLSAAGFIACLASLLGFLGRFHWFLDLFSHFRVQYLAGLIIITGILLRFARRRMAFVFGAFALLNLLLLVPYLLPFKKTVSAPDVLRAVLINVNTHAGDPQAVIQFVAQSQPDFLVLQEVSDTWLTALEELDSMYPHQVLKPRSDNFGMALFSQLPISKYEVTSLGKADVPSILATLSVGERQVDLIATHPVPPIGALMSDFRNDQLAHIPGVMNPGHATLLMGDLNCTPWNFHFKKMLKQTDLLDSAKGRGWQPSWPSFFLPLGIPIDHCLHTPDLTVTKRRIGPDVGSDHYPLVVEFF